MLQAPLPIHRLHKIEVDGEIFIADLDACRVVKASDLIWKILQLCPRLSSEEIIRELEGEEDKEEIIGALEWLEGRRKEGLFFDDGVRPPQSGRIRILAPTSLPHGADMRWRAVGAPISHRKLLIALSEFADVFVNHREDASDGLRFFPLNPKDRSSVLRAMEFGLSSFFSDFCYARSITGGYGRGSEGFATRLWDLLGEEALRDLVSIPRLDLASRAVRRLSEVLVMIERAEDEISLGRRLAERGDADLEDLFHMARFWRGFFGSRLRLAEAVKLSWESAPPELIDGRIKLAFRACGAMAAEIALITSFVPVFGYSDETCRESLLELLAEEKEFLGELDHKRLKEMGLTELVARGEEPEELEITELLNVPNPCDGRTTFIWRLSREAEEAELAIYTTSGRLVRRFRGLEASRGGNELDVRLDLPNGVYIYRLKVRDGDKAVSRTGLLAVLR